MAHLDQEDLPSQVFSLKVVLIEGVSHYRAELYQRSLSYVKFLYLAVSKFGLRAMGDGLPNHTGSQAQRNSRIEN